MRISTSIRWLETGSPWEGDEMTEREQFEKAFPVPDGAVWWDVIEAYCRKNKTTVHQYNDKWQAWQAARATPALPQVPEGMAIVPVEPTPKMIVAFRNSNGFQDGYKAMLAATKEKGE